MIPLWQSTSELWRMREEVFNNFLASSWSIFKIPCINKINQGFNIQTKTKTSTYVYSIARSLDRRREMERKEEENGKLEETQPSPAGSICGFSSLHRLLKASLQPHHFQAIFLLPVLSMFQFFIFNFLSLLVCLQLEVSSWIFIFLFLFSFGCVPWKEVRIDFY